MIQAGDGMVDRIEGMPALVIKFDMTVLADIFPSDNGSDVTIERFLQLTTWKIRFGSYIEGEQ